ncbi:dynamin family protein [Paenibacillus silagei]|uniref:GTPase n=1 Tax=Paenibacillus silagei TaxID=1670801 RepID=A0ABS4NVM2_9BACL|nr:dynamin family protein [Paenibacillus silagei]MBP2114101.1 putative GTPase [Paenibacillus silagei]
MSTIIHPIEAAEDYAGFTSTVDSVANNLSAVASEHDLQLVSRLRQNFILKTTDFYRENRKLSIGVIGQVKAGKSSFLNSLLFQGAEVLPKASTPKTATLTKMEYAEQNRIHVEYYTPEEWEVLEDNAAVDSEEDIYQSAREIVGMVERSGIEPLNYLEKGTEDELFDSYEHLIAHLNDYVGEDGRFTPLVKAVTLFLNKEEFKGISIVDTPGLNDPIASRTVRTKEFMEVCDVVFFLSQTGSFLDKSDWALLSTQLPQKGVKKLVLVASKFDSGIRDVLRHKDEDDIFGGWEDDNSADTIAGAYAIISRKLNRRAREKVAEFTEDLRRRNSPEPLIQVIGECGKPVFISAIAYNMSLKQPAEYNMEEQNICRGLQEFSKDLAADLKLLSNMSTIQEIYAAVVEEKTEILRQKAKGFVPTALEELKQLLGGFREKAEKQLALLSGSDRERLLEQKRAMENQISSIRADVVTVFGELNARLEAEKSEAVRDLRKASSEHSRLSERTGTEVKTGSRTYSTSKWYKPKSWGTSRTEHYSYEVAYSYLDVADALDNLRSYSIEAMNQIEEMFSESIQLKEIKRKLLTVVVNNFDMGSEKYDPAFFRLLVEEKINGIEFPVIKLDITEATNRFVSKFSGEITSASDKTNMQNAMLSAVNALFETMSTQLSERVKVFKADMNEIAGQLSVSLLASVQAEFDELLQKYENRQQEIEKYREYIYMLSDELKRL